MAAATDFDDSTFSFYALSAISVVGTAAAMVFTPPTAPPALPASLPVLFVLGLYLATCSTFFPDFPLYRAKVRWATALYGEHAQLPCIVLSSQHVVCETPALFLRRFRGRPHRWWGWWWCGLHPQLWPRCGCWCWRWCWCWCWCRL